MRRLLMCCGLVLVGLCGYAQDSTSPRLPFNPFADAKEGDWATYAFSGDARDEAPPTITYRVQKLTDDQVTLVQEALVPGQEKAETETLTASRKGLPTLDDVFGERSTKGMVNVKTTEEKHKVGGREFDCMRITCSEKGDGKDEGASFMLWFSKDVKVRGLVEMRIVEAAPLKQKTTMRLVGYGNGEKAEWGLRPEENVADGGQRRLPINPFAKAAAGDWATYAGSVTDDKGKASDITETWRVTAVSGDTVKVSVNNTQPALSGDKTDETTLSTKEAPTLTAMVHGEQEHLNISDVKFKQEKHKVGDRDFDCWRVTFKSTPDHFAGPYQGTLWISDEVKGAGIVEMRYVSTDKGGPHLSLKLTGFGSGEKADWGVCPVARAEFKVKKEPPHPDNPTPVGAEVSGKITLTGDMGKGGLVMVTYGISADGCLEECYAKGKTGASDKMSSRRGTAVLQLSNMGDAWTYSLKGLSLGYHFIMLAARVRGEDDISWHSAAVWRWVLVKEEKESKTVDLDLDLAPDDKKTGTVVVRDPSGRELIGPMFMPLDGVDTSADLFRTLVLPNYVAELHFTAKADGAAATFAGLPPGKYRIFCATGESVDVEVKAGEKTEAKLEPPAGK